MECTMNFESRLFDPERKQRPEYWQFIKLVAPTNERKKWRSKEAEHAYCLKCKLIFTHTKGTSKQIERHMKKYHPEDLDFKPPPAGPKKRKSHQQSKRPANKKLKPVKKVTPDYEAVAQKGHHILLKWIAESFRPLSIVEDPGFIEYSAFVNDFEKKYTVPSRSTITNLLRAKYEDAVIAIKAMVSKECENYTLTSDVWSSRTCKAYISLMVHYLTSDFDMKVVTLRCAPLSNAHHSEIEIANIIKNSLEHDNMCLNDMVMYVTDNSSNAVKSATELCLNHQACVADTLNLIVQNFIRMKNEHSNQPNLDGTADELGKIASAIATVREYARYFANSTVGSQWLKECMQRVNRSPKKIPLDVVTRWDSTLHMLKIAVDLRDHLDEFWFYIHTEEGRSKFKNCSKIEPISHEQWFLLENVCNILDLFDHATKVLLSEKYPTWSLTLPVLRAIENNLGEYMVAHGVPHAHWYNGAKTTVEVFRNQMLTEVTNRFREMQASLLWIILLDPRLTAMNGFSKDECLKAKEWLLQEMRKVPEKVRQVLKMEDNTRNSSLPQKNFIFDDIFAAPEGINDNAGEGPTTTEQSDESELERYLGLCRNSKAHDPLLWWKIHCKEFPVLAWLSRKWLSAVSTNVSPERLFSGTGATVTARRAKLSDDHVEILSYIHDNMNFASLQSVKKCS